MSDREALLAALRDRDRLASELARVREELTNERQERRSYVTCWEDDVEWGDKMRDQRDSARAHAKRWKALAKKLRRERDEWETQACDSHDFLGERLDKAEAERDEWCAKYERLPRDHTRLDIMWQELVIERDRLREELRFAEATLLSVTDEWESHCQSVEAERDRLRAQLTNALETIAESFHFAERADALARLAALKDVE